MDSQKTRGDRRRFMKPITQDIINSHIRRKNLTVHISITTLSQISKAMIEPESLQRTMTTLMLLLPG